MKNLTKLKIPVFVVLMLFLASCSMLNGLTAPKSFDQGLSAAYAVQTSALNTTTRLLEQKQIKKDDAIRVLAISDEAGKALDSARDLRKADLSTAESQLTLASAILSHIMEYLSTRGK